MARLRLMAGWTTRHVRHGVSLVRQGRNPAATVYDSLGPDFFLALAPGWLNLGLWEGDGGDPAEAPVAVRRLVEVLAADLPRGGDILDVGNGLAVQDPVIARVAEPRSLTAVNITLSQLAAGRGALADAGARGVNADATRLPIADASMDGVISVEAAFHFSSRAAFFAEAHQVLRPGGVLTMSDIPVERTPRGPVELAAGLMQLRAWGLGARSVATSAQILSLAQEAGFTDVRTQLVGRRTIAPALRSVRDRLAAGLPGVPRGQVLAGRAMRAGVDLLWNHGIIDYLLLRAVA